MRASPPVVFKKGAAGKSPLYNTEARYVNNCRFNRERKINSHVRQLSKLGVNIPDKILLAAIAIRR